MEHGHGWTPTLALRDDLSLQIRRGVGLIAALPMYDWPEVGDHLDSLWQRIRSELAERGIQGPDGLTRLDDLEKIWRDPGMILGQVCSLNPVRDGLGETEVLGTFAYETPPGLPTEEPGDYYSVLACRRSDVESGRRSVADFAGCRVAANGTDSQSGYWSLGHLVEHRVAEGPFFGPVEFTGAHRDSIRSIARGDADLAVIDVHSWRLALDHEPAVEELAVIGSTQPTPGVVCVISWELVQLRPLVNDAIVAAVDALTGTAVLAALHISGYRRRRMEEFQVVADQVEAAGRLDWHA